MVDAILANNEYTKVLLSTGGFHAVKDCIEIGTPFEISSQVTSRQEVPVTSTIDQGILDMIKVSQAALQSLREEMKEQMKSMEADKKKFHKQQMMLLKMESRLDDMEHSQRQSSHEDMKNRH
ncbi:hypothetical protein BGX31_002653 [Mortierella sp. GBA43]|nr:hypothetical protein BGX31_002653 [Mortierella sp. GBA43]